MKLRAQVGWAAIAGLGAGVALGALLPDGPVPSAPPGLAGAAAIELEALRHDLELARRERDALALQLAALEPQSDGAQAPVPELADASDLEAEPTGEAAEPVAFDEAWLREAGYADSEIARLRERWDQSELDRLYLIDQAKREGWHRSQRYRDLLRQHHERLREEHGDDRYDLLLYAAGHGNRVVVADVLADSPASRAGLEQGDVIRSYAGRRLFDMADLLRTTSGGEPGHPTELRIERNGEEIRYFVPRGPLGVRIRRDRRVPDTLR
jgi:hypothetical protein